MDDNPIGGDSIILILGVPIIFFIKSNLFALIFSGFGKANIDSLILKDCALSPYNTSNTSK